MTEPLEALEDAVTVSVLVAAEGDVILTGFVVREHASPVVPAQLKLTLPVKPCTGVTVIVSVVELPWETVSDALPEVIWKSATATVTFNVTEFVRLPLVPVTVTVPVCAVVVDPDVIVRLANPLADPLTATVLLS